MASAVASMVASRQSLLTTARSANAQRGVWRASATQLAERASSAPVSLPRRQASAPLRSSTALAARRLRSTASG